MTSAGDYFPVIETYLIAPSLFSETLRVLREQGHDRGESLVFWAGRLVEPEAEVDTIIVPKGSGVELHPTHVRISDDAMARVAAFIDPPEIVLLSQVHTHGGIAFHSPVDDIHGFGSPGFVSMVVPHYGEGVAADLRAWGVFECVSGSEFRELPPAEVRRRFRVRPALGVRILEAGDD